MEKNEDLKKFVTVVDEFGNELEPTYLKRAKGLVKFGRARFIEQNKICLITPQNKNIFEERKVKEEQKLDSYYIIKKIDEITEQGKVIIEKVGTLSTEASQALIAREETNCKIIELLKEILDRVYPKVDLQSMNSKLIDSLTESLNTAITSSSIDAQQAIIKALLEIQSKSTRK